MFFQKTKVIQKFESIGFTHEQAEALAETIEQAQVASQEDLKGFIRNEFDSKLNSLEARLMASQKDLLMKIFGIIVGTVGVAVTILKHF
ncbi:MAG: hypothetical protein MRJ65_07910 [Candidatus Brocadiaceae bacterium]|nr:hypothetical protein [Candidatus Brocadiaceae bacterium]